MKKQRVDKTPGTEPSRAKAASQQKFNKRSISEQTEIALNELFKKAWEQAAAN